MASSIKYAIGFDIGGTKIEASIVSSRGEVLKTLRKPVIKEFQALFHQMSELIHELSTADYKFEGVGFSIPGSIDPKTRKLRNAPNSPEINETDFFDQLTQTLKLPSQIENDANCLALSEYFFGAAQGYRNVVGIIMGTGFGGGVLLDGKMLHGAQGLAPEVGHTIIDVNGRVCLCGNKGCVEAYLSGPSILKRYHEAGGKNSIEDTKTLFEQGHDPIAKQIIDETRYMFSRVMAALTSMYDPEIIVLGGGLSLQPLYYTCENDIAGYVFGAHQAPLIKQAKLGDASGKLGAAALFF